jgi:hypothetical protein
MATDQRLVLRLEVDREADPITGILSQPGEVSRSFTGWLDLTDVIESIRRPDDVSNDQRGNRDA